VLFAVDAAGVVVGFARLDPPPGPAEVPPGGFVSYTGFGPMYRCPGVGDVATYPYLDSGQYTAYVGQLFSDLGYSLPLSMWERVGALAVTDTPGATRTQVELPVLPECGESIDGFAFDSAFPAGMARFAGRASWSIEDERLVEDPGGGPAVTYEFTYDGPTHELTFLDENVVLVRDGVVVADEYTGGWGGAQPETWTDGDTRTAAFTIFHDCAAEEDYTEFEPTGPYTILGFTVYDYIDEFGLPNYVVATLGPTEVDFGER